MFRGFSDETFEFLMALRFNNNTEFFHANHDWYLRALREPCLELTTALSNTIASIDDDLERRPNRVVSRINRDIRYSRDKSPYRDYLWLSFRVPGEHRKSTVGFYCDISLEGMSFGMGMYEENKPLLNGLRRSLLARPDAFIESRKPSLNDLALSTSIYKRMKIPEGLRPELAPWYPIRNFYLSREITDFDLIKSPEVADVISEGFMKLAPLYKHLQSLSPVDD